MRGIFCQPSTVRLVGSSSLVVAVQEYSAQVLNFGKKILFSKFSSDQSSWYFGDLLSELKDKVYVMKNSYFQGCIIIVDMDTLIIFKPIWYEMR